VKIISEFKRNTGRCVKKYTGVLLEKLRQISKKVMKNSRNLYKSLITTWYKDVILLRMISAKRIADLCK